MKTFHHFKITSTSKNKHEDYDRYLQQKYNYTLFLDSTLYNGVAIVYKLNVCQNYEVISKETLIKKDFDIFIKFLPYEGSHFINEDDEEGKKRTDSKPKPKAK